MDYKADPLRKLVKKGKAMPAPGQDRPGRFPIADAKDLDNAVRAVGRVVPQPGETKEEAMAKVRRFIMKRANALGISHPAFKNWNADGSLKT